MLSLVMLLLIVASIEITDLTGILYSTHLTKVGAFFDVGQTVAQAVVSAEMLGRSASGLLYGPLSDRYGRRPVMLVGMAIFTLSGFVSCLADSIVVLALARFVQGLGAGVASVVGYAMVNESCSAEERSKNMTVSYVLVSTAGVVGPIVGSCMMSYGHDWRAIAVVSLVCSAVLLFFLVLKLQETMPDGQRTTTFSLVSVVSGYIALARNLKFLGYCMVKGLTMMWILSSVGNLPFIFIEGMGLPAEYYGYLAAIGSVAFIVGTLINVKLVNRFCMRKVVAVSLAVSIIPDVILLGIYRFVHLTPLVIELIWIPSSLCLPFVIGNSTVLAFGELENKGTASAFIIFCQAIFGALGIYIVGKFYDGTIVPISVLPLVCCCVSLVILYYIHKADEKNSRLKLKVA
ncbi:MAG: MFS transporter [Anaplasma sp.]